MKMNYRKKQKKPKAIRPQSHKAMAAFCNYPTNDPVPVDLLSCHDAELVCKNLCRFVLETRNSNGQPYPPATIRSLLSGLNRTLKSNKAPFSIFNKEDTRFRDLQLTLDSVSSKLHKKGIGLHVTVLPLSRKKMRILCGLKEHLELLHHKFYSTPYSFTFLP